MWGHGQERSPLCAASAEDNRQSGFEKTPIQHDGKFRSSIRKITMWPSWSYNAKDGQGETKAFKRKQVNDANAARREQERIEAARIVESENDALIKRIKAAPPAYQEALTNLVRQYREPKEARYRAERVTSTKGVRGKYLADEVVRTFQTKLHTLEAAYDKVRDLQTPDTADETFAESVRFLLRPLNALEPTPSFQTAFSNLLAQYQGNNSGYRSVKDNPQDGEKTLQTFEGHLSALQAAFTKVRDLEILFTVNETLDAIVKFMQRGAPADQHSPDPTAPLPPRREHSRAADGAPAVQPAPSMKLATPKPLDVAPPKKRER